MFTPLHLDEATNFSQNLTWFLHPQNMPGYYWLISWVPIEYARLFFLCFSLMSVLIICKIARSWWPALLIIIFPVTNRSLMFVDENTILNTFLLAFLYLTIRGREKWAAFAFFCSLWIKLTTPLVLPIYAMIVSRERWKTFLIFWFTIGVFVSFQHIYDPIHITDRLSYIFTRGTDHKFYWQQWVLLGVWLSPLIFLKREKGKPRHREHILDVI